MQGSPGHDRAAGSPGLQEPPGKPGQQGDQGNATDGQLGSDGTAGLSEQEESGEAGHKDYPAHLVIMDWLVHVDHPDQLKDLETFKMQAQSKQDGVEGHVKLMLHFFDRKADFKTN